MGALLVLFFVIMVVSEKNTSKDEVSEDGAGEKITVILGELGLLCFLCLL